MNLNEADPPLFYALLQAKLDQLLPLLYTPTGAQQEIYDCKFDMMI